MKRRLLIVVGILVVLLVGVGWLLQEGGEESRVSTTPSFTDQEVGFDDEPPNRPPEKMTYRVGKGRAYTLAELRTWERPAGPLRVGIQIGHLDNGVVPAELSGLTRNGAGATANGVNEREVMSTIVPLLAAELEAEGVTVDILPATVPPGYVADAFVSMHADGNADPAVRGFKIAGPRRDYSGRSTALVAALQAAYAAETDLPEDPNITRRMSAYYAFNWPRYVHAVHPYTPAAIVEAGFLTNPSDRALLVNAPNQVASAVAAGVLAYLDEIPEPAPPPQTLVAPTFPLTGIVDCAPVRAERRNRAEQGCLPSLFVDETHYGLKPNARLATSSFPYRATVRGTYVPIQNLDNYFWFHWEVAGIIDATRIERQF